MSEKAPDRSSRRMTLFVIGLVGLVIGVGLGDAWRLVSHRTSMEPVDITLVDSSSGNGIRFSVPKAYLKRNYDRGGGQPTDFVIETIYPDMTPRSLSDSSDFDGLDDERFSIHIWVFPGDPAGVARSIGHRVDQLPKTVSDREPSFTIYNWESSRDYLIPAEHLDEKTLYFDCIPFEAVREPTRQRIRCTAYAGFGDRLLVRYSYQRRHLNRWRDVDVKVKSLLQTFVIGCFESDGAKENVQIALKHDCNF
jgi:hypothetical protein